MNNATKNLEDDHIYILKLIDVMELMTDATVPVVSDLEEGVALIKNFADGLHHAKEEALLFPLMAERGFSTQQGPIAVMLHDHTQGRNFVKGMSENIKLLKAGDLSAITVIYYNIQGYGELLRNHIAKENNVLFRMADNALSESDQEALFMQFKKVENQDLPNNQKSDFIARIEKLAQVYNLKHQNTKANTTY
ncbi:MAG: hemerythrin domain-containing protein [Bacteroidia bacterium]|nr:hemerythrin domain-containing protein [Bacteroidia bacterium]